MNQSVCIEVLKISLRLMCATQDYIRPRGFYKAGVRGLVGQAKVQSPSLGKQGIQVRPKEEQLIRFAVQDHP